MEDYVRSKAKLSTSVFCGRFVSTVVVRLSGLGSALQEPFSRSVVEVLRAIREISPNHLESQEQRF